MKVGSIGYATSQGLGHLMKWFYDHRIINDVLVWKHRCRPENMDWYPPGTPIVTGLRGDATGPFLKRNDVILGFETFFDWEIVNWARRVGKKTALMVMYEWAPHDWSRHPKPDLILCPSLLDMDYFPEGKYLPVPVEISNWRSRDKALRFLHNAGNIGCREHKGTRQLIEAIPYIKSPIQLTIRAQDVTALNSVLQGNSSVLRDPRVKIEYGEIPYDQLFANHDVYVAPEKFNGLSLPLQEAYSAGMMVMATNRHPHNKWLPKEGLIDVDRYQQARVAGWAKEFSEAIVSPERIAATIDNWYGKDITYFNDRSRVWTMENSWERLKPRYLETFEELVG